MLRRALLVAAAAVALILAPSVAMAYEAPGFNATVSDPTPGIGQAVTVSLSGNAANAAVTLTVSCSPSVAGVLIDGVTGATRTKNANATGVVSFSVAVNGTSTCTLTMTSATGNVLATQVLTVSAANSAVPQVPANPAAVGTSTGGLSATGFGGGGIAAGGGVLLLVGAGAVLVARRRHSSDVSA